MVNRFSLRLTEKENLIIAVRKESGMFRVQIINRYPNESEDVLWQDSQKIPFWRSEKRRKETWEIIKKIVPEITEAQLNAMNVDLASADEIGDIPSVSAKSGEKFEGQKVTDKQITDTILARHLFYCDEGDPNLPLYAWDDTRWCNSRAESIILYELSELFKDAENRANMLLERTTNFIKGQAMKTEVEPKPPYLIPVLNGLYNIHAGNLEPHDSKYFYVNTIPHNYVPDASCPKFLKWLSEVINEEDVPFLQEWVGYQFYDKVPEAAFLILIGVGQNGKTVIIDILIKMLGESNVTNISLAALTYDVFERAELYHKLANLSDDIGSEVIRNAGKLKAVSSGSMITVQRKFGQPHDIHPYAKLTYTANEPPEIQDRTEAIKMRLKTVEFPWTFAKQPIGDEKLARDRGELEAELSEEIPGIINWALEGLKRLITNKFKFSISRSTEETWVFYQRKSNPVLAFIDECINLAQDENDKISPEDLYQCFSQWIETTKIKMRVKRAPFFKKLKEEGIESRQKREDDRKRYYYGITVTASRLPPRPLILVNDEIREERDKRRKEEYKESNARRDGVTPPLTPKLKETSEPPKDLGKIITLPLDIQGCPGAAAILTAIADGSPYLTYKIPKMANAPRRICFDTLATLSEKGYVELEEWGEKTVVKITEKGKEVL